MGQNGTIRKEQASFVTEGVILDFDGHRVELMSVKQKSSGRLALRLSDGTTKLVSATAELSVVW